MSTHVCGAALLVRARALIASLLATKVFEYLAAQPRREAQRRRVETQISSMDM